MCCKTNLFNRLKEKTKEQEKNTLFFDKRMISSSHINFLFGSGINGTVIPQMKDCEKTLSLIEEYGGDVSKGLEGAIDDLENPEQREDVKECLLKN